MLGLTRGFAGFLKIWGEDSFLFGVGEIQEQAMAKQRQKALKASQGFNGSPESAKLS